ncbi:MAG: permease-like cell division protein FtsX [Bacteroidales bacterium]|nr:permease-like cell division protein FtsX [Bacteroidales bacterium]
MAKTGNKAIRHRLAGAWISSVLSIALVLVLVGIAAFLAVNSRSVSNYFKENMQMEVLLKQEVSEEAAAGYAASAGTLPYVKSARLVTREEGKKELEDILGKDFLEVFESTSIPLSVEITLKADYVNSDSLGMVTAALAASPLVDDVESRATLVDALNSNLSVISIVLGVLIALLVFISYVLIGNTVRLNIFARRFTIHTMQLVGAPLSFIRRPFMRSAVVMGVVASLIATAILGAGGYLAFRNFPEIMALFGWKGLLLVAAIILVCGVGICMVSTFFAVNRLSGMDKDQLYY